MNNLTSLSEQEQKELITKRASKEGFPEFAIAVDPQYKLEWFHREIALKLEEAYQRVQRGEDVRLMIFMPPRHGKSDLATKKFPAWVLGKSPEVPVIVSSYSQDLATSFGQGTRDLMNTPIYKKIFDTALRDDTQAKANWLTAKGGGYLAVGIGGTITGKGFKFGIIDDPFKNREEADSPVIRDSRHAWYRSTFSTREEGNSAIILILTRWHDDDLAGRLLKEQSEAEKNGDVDYDKWEVLQYKAIADRDDSHRKQGDALWPDKFSIEKLNKKKATMGIFEWSALYQQTPIDEASQEFRKDWVRYRTAEDASQMITRKFATIDTAMSKGSKSDSTGVTRNYVDLANNWNIKCRRYRINPKELIELIFTLYNEGFEQIGIEEGVYNDVIQPFLKDECVVRQKYPYIITLKHNQVMKETRIRGLVPRYETGKIFHIYGECDDLEEELLKFPKAAHDDCPDSLAYQIQIAEPPVEGGDDFNMYGSKFH